MTTGRASAAIAQLPEKYLGRGLNPEYVALWESYLEEGMGYKHVGELFGVHETTVAKRFPGRGWTHAQAVELGTFMKHHNAKMRKVAGGLPTRA